MVAVYFSQNTAPQQCLPCTQKSRALNCPPATPGSLLPGKACSNHFSPQPEHQGLPGQLFLPRQLWRPGGSQGQRGYPCSNPIWPKHPDSPEKGFRVFTEPLTHPAAAPLCPWEPQSLPHPQVVLGRSDWWVTGSVLKLTVSSERAQAGQLGLHTPLLLLAGAGLKVLCAGKHHPVCCLLWGP